jgi:hypothetical protein
LVDHKKMGDVGVYDTRMETYAIFADEQYPEDENRVDLFFRLIHADAFILILTGFTPVHKKLHDMAKSANLNTKLAETGLAAFTWVYFSDDDDRIDKLKEEAGFHGRNLIVIRPTTKKPEPAQSEPTRANKAINLL